MIDAGKQSFSVFLMLRSRKVQSRQNELQIITITILFLELFYMHMKRNLKQFYTYLCLLALIICPFHLSKVNTEMCPVGVSFNIEVELVPVCYFLTGCVFDY